MRQALGPGALGKPRGSGWRGRWEGGLGWGTHVNPWLFHSNVWQNSLQKKKKRAGDDWSDWTGTGTPQISAGLPTGEFSWGERQNSVECSSEVILVGRRVQGSSPRGHLSPWSVWLVPTLSVNQFQEHLTHLFMLRANCPIFQPGTVPLVIFFQSQWSICLASKHCQARSILEGGWGGEQENYSATQ